MLQQTQVQTVIPYWTRWMDAFPDARALAAAPEEQVLKLWEGLGYYSRARNLHRAAAQITASTGARFPTTVEGLLDLPGIGRYTAGAIASIAFGQPAPILDGNVIRVLTRLLTLAGDPRGRPLHELLWSRARELVVASDGLDDVPMPWGGVLGACSALNQSLMELGGHGLPSEGAPMRRMSPRGPLSGTRPGNPGAIPGGCGASGRRPQGHRGRGPRAGWPVLCPKTARRRRQFRVLGVSQSRGSGWNPKRPTASRQPTRHPAGDPRSPPPDPTRHHPISDPARELPRQGHRPAPGPRFRRLLGGAPGPRIARLHRGPPTDRGVPAPPSTGRSPRRRQGTAGPAGAHRAGVDSMTAQALAIPDNPK